MSIKCTLLHFRAALKKKNLDGKTEVEDVVSELEKLKEKDPGSNYIIGYTDVEEAGSEDPPDGRKEIAYVFFQTSSMKSSVSKFPEVMGMDTTHKVNKNDMNLVVMQCIDNHKNGRTAAYGLIARETKEILEATLRHFKDENPSAADKVKAVIVDKDYKEIGGTGEKLASTDAQGWQGTSSPLYSGRLENEASSL